MLSSCILKLAASSLFIDLAFCSVTRHGSASRLSLSRQVDTSAEHLLNTNLKAQIFYYI